MPMTTLRQSLLSVLAMLAFAGNSLLCRAALENTRIDAATFTLIRVFSAAMMLWVIVSFRRQGPFMAPENGDWLSATALFIYMAAFSFAYLQLSAASGALLLFCAVQMTMMFYGWVRGERLCRAQLTGFLLAMTGLLTYLLPRFQQPSLSAALLMLVAGVAWGVYSLRGRTAVDPLAVTSGNFARAVPLALLLSVLMSPSFTVSGSGIFYALLSGVFASAIGYVIWYAVLPSLNAMHASAMQLSVPVIAAVAALLWLAEPLPSRLMLVSALVLGGLALMMLCGKRNVP